MDFSHEQRFTPKNAGGFGVVVIVHALLAGALIYGLHTVTRTLSPPPINVKVDPPTSKPVEPQPTVDPGVKKFNIDVTPIDRPIIDPTIHDQLFHHPQTVDPGPAVNPGPIDSGPGESGAGTSVKPVIHSSNPVISNLDACKPSYPNSALKMEEEGTVRLKLEIGASGQLVSASVLKSSGYADLDRAAVKGLSQCAFKAAVQDGTPVQSSLVTDYVWVINR